MQNCCTLILQRYKLIIKLDLNKHSWDAVCIRLESHFMQITKTQNYMPVEVQSTVRVISLPSKRAGGHKLCPALVVVP